MPFHFTRLRRQSHISEQKKYTNDTAPIIPGKLLEQKSSIKEELVEEQHDLKLKEENHDRPLVSDKDGKKQKLKINNSKSTKILIPNKDPFEPKSK